MRASTNTRAAKARIFQGDGVQVLNRDDARSLAMALPGRRSGDASASMRRARAGLRHRATASSRRGKDMAARGMASCRSTARTTPPTRSPPARWRVAAGVPAGSPRGGAAQLPGPAASPASASRCAAASNGTTTPRAPMSARPSPRCGAWRARRVLILGGEGKGQDFAPLAPRGARSARRRCCSSAATRRSSSRRSRAACRSSAARRSRKPWQRAAQVAAAGRGRAAFARVRELRHVPRLQAPRRSVRRGGARRLPA